MDETPSMDELDQALQTGHPLIDHQHQALLSLCLGLQQAMREQASGADLLRRLLLLQRLLAEHFQCEERVMREQGYPAYAPHRQEHQRLLAELAPMVPGWDDGQLPEMAALEGIEQMIIDHVKGFDLGLALYMRRQARG